MRLSHPLRYSLCRTKPWLAAATLALLAGCANGFDPVKIVIAPVTEFLNQMDNAKQAKNTEQDKDPGNARAVDSAKPAAKPTAKPAQATATKTATAKPAAQKPAAPDPNRPATWNGLPVGEMSVDGETVLVVSATSGTSGYDISLKKYRSLAENEGVLHLRANKSRLCYGTSGLPALSSAYLDDDGTIVNITDMKADSDGDCAERPVSRVLTMPYRWFDANGIVAGATVTDFKPVTVARKTELAAQAFVAKQRMSAMLEEEKKAEAEKKKPENLAKAARTPEFLRDQIARKKPDQKLAEMREVSTPSGSLLALIKEPTFCSGGFISFCVLASKFERPETYPRSDFDLKEAGLSPLLPNEAVLFLAGDKFVHWYTDVSGQDALSIAFINDSGKIIDVRTRYKYEKLGIDGILKNGRYKFADIQAKSPAHALIANADWFDEHKLKVGDTITFKPVTAKRRDELYAQGIKQAQTMLTQLIQDDKQQVQQKALAAAKRAGGNLEQMLQAGKAYNHSYLCKKEEAQGMLYVQSRDADGSVNAIYDLAVADIEKNIVTGVRVQLKGSKNADGAYDFTPVRTLKNSPQYKVNRIRAFGNLAQLDVNLSGSACATPEQMELWVKAPDNFASVAMPVSANLANCALHRADFYYKAEREATRLPNSASDEGEHLGVRLVAAGRAPLPGEPATTGHLFRIDTKTETPFSKMPREDSKLVREYTLSQPCPDSRSAYQCLHRNVVAVDKIQGQRLQPKTGGWQNYTGNLKYDSAGFLAVFVP